MHFIYSLKDERERVPNNAFLGFYGRPRSKMKPIKLRLFKKKFMLLFYSENSQVFLNSQKMVIKKPSSYLFNTAFYFAFLSYCGNIWEMLNGKFLNLFPVLSKKRNKL